jgi:hypothetical protein
MEDVIKVNQYVSVVAYYFRGRSIKCFPKRIEYGGRQIVFSETGLTHPTVKGKRMVHVFDMTDGQADYRLEFDAETLSWKLVYIADMHYASAA